MPQLTLKHNLCDLATGRFASIQVLEHAATAHIAREAPCEPNGVVVLCAALHELEVLQRHVVVGGGAKQRSARHEGRECCRCSVLFCRLGGCACELRVPIVEVKLGWCVQPCENGLRRKLLWMKPTFRDV